MTDSEHIELGGQMPHIDLWRTSPTKRQPGIWIGAKWRDSQINASTPRTRSEVEYLGAHAEHLQRALIEPVPSLRERIVDGIWWAIGIGLVVALMWASLRVPG